MSKHSAPYWEELSELLVHLGILTAGDRMALALLCDQLALYVRARRRVERDGIVAQGTHGPYQHPAVGVMNTAWKNAMKAAVEFGLTPSARSGVEMRPPEKVGRQGKARFFVQQQDGA